MTATIDKDWKFDCSICAVPYLTFISKAEQADMCWGCHLSPVSKIYLSNMNKEDAVSSHTCNIWDICKFYNEGLFMGKFIDPDKKIWKIMRDRADLEDNFIPDSYDTKSIKYLAFILNSGYFCLGYDMITHIKCDISTCDKGEVGRIIAMCQKSKDPNAKLIMQKVKAMKEGSVA